MTNLRILFLLTQHIDSPSGLGRYGPLARELTRLGHQVSILALHPNLTSLEERSVKSEGVSIHYVAPMHVIKMGDTKSYYSTAQLGSIAARATIHLFWYSLKSPAEIIHICKPHPMNSIAGIGSQFLKKKLVFVDCDDHEAESGNFANDSQKKIVSYFERHIPRYVRGVTTNTHFMQQNLISWGVPPDNITYIPNGVELNRFTLPTPESLHSTRARLGIAGKRVISYIGTVGYASHPVYLLVEAFARIHAQKPDTILLIVGGGEDIGALKALAIRLRIDHAVYFTGRIPPDEVAVYYYLSDISVDPVNDDDAARGRSPLKLFECWACGIPFVTADVGDRSDLIGSPPAGLLARPGDASSLASTILQLIDNPSLAAEIRQAGLERVKQFTWEALTGQLEKLYLEQRLT